MQTVLVTGGAGYIGSHTTLMLLQAGYNVVVLDNFCNSDPESLRRVRMLAGRELEAVIEGDIRDPITVERVFDAHRPQAVIHFAGLKAVGESVAQPLRYYDNNVCGSVVLAQAMTRFDVQNLVFSSSATVYGDPVSVPIDESFPLAPTNPYGQSKAMVEQVFRDLALSGPGWKIVLLRYFNPVGAHPSGMIGEDPAGIPNNLMPFVAQVAVGRREILSVFGGDWPTPDGTGVRDYIHVMDLAAGHVNALAHIGQIDGAQAVNLGTGSGYSVLEAVAAFERASGRPVPYRVVERRAGDIAQCWADASLAERLFEWRAQRGLDEMCRDAWAWQSANPLGYGSN